MNNCISIRFIMISAAIILLQGFVVSCAKVEYEGDSIENFEGSESLDKIEKSKIRFNVEWPEDLPEEEKPEYITVVMNRIQNYTVRYIFVLDKNGNVVRTITSPEPEPEVTPEDTPSEASEEEVPQDDGRPNVHNGFYSVAAVASKGDEAFNIPDLEAFESNLDISLKSLYVIVPEISSEEKAENRYINFNPIYPYIKYGNPFYYVRPAMDSNTLVSSKESDNVINLYPRLLTRKIYISIPINVEEEVIVDRFTGVISGVPQQAQLMTGYVSDQGLGKMPFEMSLVSDNVYRGYINAFGLFSPDKDDMIVGPGIFTIILHAHTTDEKGRVHNRIFHASLNFKTLIDKAEIMLQTQDKSGYVFSDLENTDENGRPMEIKTFDLVYPQENALKLTKEMVLSGGEQGYEIWQVGGEDDNEEVNPGLNPEM